MLLRLLVLFVLSAPVWLGTTAQEVRAETPRNKQRMHTDTSAAIPSRSSKIGYRYNVHDRNGQLVEIGVIEPGSWAEFALVAAANHRREPGFGAALHQRLVADVRGKDGLPYTRDDRPFVSLDDLVSRAQLDSEDLGQMLSWIRTHPEDHLERDERWWSIAEGFIFDVRVERHMLALANRCNEARLRDPVALPPRLVAELAKARPITQIRDLADVRYVGRATLVRMAYFARALSCEPGVDDSPERLVEELPSLRLAALIYDEHHFAELLQELVDVAETTPGNTATRRAAAEETLATRLARPFETFAPRPPSSLHEPDLRAAAAEHLVAQLVRDLESGPTPSWRELLESRPGDLELDLAALRGNGFEIWESDGEWIAAGPVWGLHCEVTIDLDAPQDVSAYVEFD